MIRFSFSVIYFIDASPFEAVASLWADGVLLPCAMKSFICLLPNAMLKTGALNWYYATWQMKGDVPNYIHK